MALGQRKPRRSINANYEVFTPSAGVTAFAREAALFVALAVAGAANADPMVCRTEAGVTHCEAPLNHYRVKAMDLFRGQKGPPLDKDRGGRADHRHAASTRGDIGGPKRTKTGRCVRCPRANGAPSLGSRLMGKDSGGLDITREPQRRWRLLSRVGRRAVEA